MSISAPPAKKSTVNRRILPRHWFPLAVARRALAGLVVACAGCAHSAKLTPPSPASNPGTAWPATDALGRALPLAPDISAPRPGRTVGMFYFLWHNVATDRLPNDLAKILPQDSDLLKKPDSPLWGPKGPYYWGQPLYGYYQSTDPWVLRRHATLLADAGIDTVIFDTTNRRTYPDVYLKLCEVWTQIRREGGRTPQVCFMVNTKAGDTARELYRDLYQKNLYPDLWFRWQGKPLLICDPKEAGPELAKFFTLRKAHWPFTQVNTPNAWHWEATYPQAYSYDGDPAKPEQVNVSVAQNLRADNGKVTNMSEGKARGRSFHDGGQNIAPDSVNRGANFAEQWQRAYELDPPFVMVTDWNEWTAGRFSRPQLNLPVVFVDQYDQEFSRDIEPVAGLHRDNYYNQLVAGVRRYKGAPPLPPPAPSCPIPLDAGFGAWAGVTSTYADHAFDDAHRDFGRGERHYVNHTGRNDIIHAKVAHDTTNVYFYAQTREPLTPSSDSNWMWLLLDTDHNAQTGWEGYDYIVHRSLDGTETWLERNTGGWAWERVAKIQLRVQGSELMLAIPRSALGLATSGALTLDFKWWDNAQKPGDIMDAYVSGDAAPDGRFNFRYTGAADDGAASAPLKQPKFSDRD